MKIQGSIITEQGQTFAIAIVKPHVLNSSDREDFRSSCQRIFGNMPVILMSQDSNGTPTYHGRPDIVKFLANLHISQIPWKEYTLS